jgi:energy-coupling factor transporter ATP-binding protein EcfA2
MNLLRASVEHDFSVMLPDHPVIAAMAGEVVQLVGASGTGKSALCLLISGTTDNPEREALVSLFGKPLNTLSDAERASAISYVPSDPYLAFSGIKSTLHGELDMVQRMVPSRSTKPDRLIADIVDRLRLSQLVGRDPFTLSGGEAVRAALAMALIKCPQLLVLDQMNEQLDRDAEQYVWEQIGALMPMRGVVVEARSRASIDSGMIKEAQSQSSDLSKNWQVSTRQLSSGSHSVRLATAPLRSGRSKNSGGSVGGEVVLTVEALEHRYAGSNFQLGPLNLEISKGERLALVGPNGIGKTTLLKSLALLETPTFDRFEIVDRDGATSSPPLERMIHTWPQKALYCFQRPENQLYLPTVYGELADTADRLGQEGALESALKLATRVGLEPYLYRSPFDLPRSYRRLIPLVAAFAICPPILLIDEPTVGLDDAQVASLTELFVEVGNTSAILFVSHDDPFVEAVSTDHLTIDALIKGSANYANPASLPNSEMHS